MLCELCKNNHANGYIQIPLNGGIKRVAVCELCYVEYKSEFETNSAVCKYCGRSFWEIKKTQIVGCEHCYDQFSTAISAYIRKVQRL